MESDFEKWVNEVFKSRNDFWNDEYPMLSSQEKKKVWYQHVHIGMRENQYSTFTKKWHDFAIETEPEFDNYFKQIVENLEKTYLCSENFNWKEYYKRISK